METFRIKFPRRVRIHGGECGAVARALHHAAQKEALMPYEQVKNSLISDEKVFLRQADSGNVLESTFIERKQMSTKTSIKRVALVAVSALGFGLLSSFTPANAAGTLTVTARGNSTVFLAGSDSVQLTVSASGIDSSVNVYGEWIATDDETDAPALLADLGSIAAAGAGVDTLAEALDEAGDDADANDEDLTGWLSANAYASASTSMLVHIDETEIDTAGDYSLRFWADVDGNGLFGSTEPTVDYSWTAGGAVTDASCSFSVSPLETTENSTTVMSCTFTDTDGNRTREAAASDFEWTYATVAVLDDGAGDASDIDLTETFGNGTRYGGSGVYTDTIYTGGTATAGLKYFTIENGAAVIETAASLTVGIRLVAIATAVTSIEVVSGQTGIYSAAASTTDTAGTASAGTAASTIYYKLTGTAGEYVKVLVAQVAATPALDLSTSTTYRLLGADGTLTFSVTNPTPVAGEAYTVTAYEDGTGDPVITTSYVDDVPTVSVISPSSAFTVKTGSTSTVVVRAVDSFSNAIAATPITVTIAGRNTGVASVITTDANGYASFSLTDTSTATVTDKPSDTLTFTVTDADGDSDDVTATITYTTTGPVVGSITLTVTDGNGTGTLSDGTDDDAANDRRITVDTVELLGSADSTSYATVKAQLKSSTGAPLGSGIVVSWSGGADDLFGSSALVASMAKTATSVTGSTGEATIYLYRHKTGSTTVTATAAGVTGTSLEITALTDDANARYISVSADPVKTISEGIIKATGTVTDRWGNPVPGVSVAFAENGAGRLYGTQTATGTTNALGQASFDMTTTKNEVGTNTVTITVTETGSQVANPAGTVAGNVKAGVTAGTASASTTIEFTVDSSVSTADALLELAKAIGTGKEVEAAADAAAEAIDAANAATDAANLAAEAADAATVAAEEARDAADAATAAVEELATQVATLMSALKAQLTTLANTVAKIAKKVKA